MFKRNFKKQFGLYLKEFAIYRFFFFLQRLIFLVFFHISFNEFLFTLIRNSITLSKTFRKSSCSYLYQNLSMEFAHSFHIYQGKIIK